MSSEVRAAATTDEHAKPWETVRRGLLLLVSSPAGAGKTGVGGGGSGLAVATAAPKPTAIALTTLAGSAPARNICVFIEVPRLVRSDLDADSIAV